MWWKDLNSAENARPLLHRPDPLHNRDQSDILLPVHNFWYPYRAAEGLYPPPPEHGKIPVLPPMSIQCRRYSLYPAMSALLSLIPYNALRTTAIPDSVQKNASSIFQAPHPHCRESPGKQYWQPYDNPQCDTSVPSQADCMQHAKYPGGWSKIRSPPEHVHHSITGS